MARHINIAAVADEAGVGVGTVSRVINGSPNVRETTRQRVLEVIERLHYRPSRLASGLSRGRVSAVGILVPHLTRPSVVERLAGAIAVLDDEGYDTVVFNVETARQRDRHVEAVSAHHRVDGVIVVSLRLNAAQLARFQRAGLPLSMIDVGAVGVARTVIDDTGGGELATRHLIELGHERIGFIGDVAEGGLGFRSSPRRLDGYRRALASAGVTYDPDLVRRGPHSAEAAAALAEALLEVPHPPTAIFAASDTQAIGVLAAAARVGVEIPDRLSVIGFDDIGSSALLRLSTVRQPLHTSGAHGAGRLCALMRGETVSPMREELALELVPRASSGPRPGSRSVGRGAGRRPRTGSFDRVTPPPSGRATAVIAGRM